jgi:hypothetical protein
MVIASNRARRPYVFISLTALILLLSVNVPPILGSSVAYRVDKVWVQIYVNEDGSINLIYNITVTYISGVPEGIITIGMPKRDFKIHHIRDAEGRSLSYQIISYRSFYGVDVALNKPIILNEPYTIIAYVFVPEMVYDDAKNPGNVGLKFYPSTFDDAEGLIGSVRVKIILPEWVKEDEVKCAERKFNSVCKEGNLIAVYWEEENWPPSEEFWVGVSFPKKYVSMGSDAWYYILVGVSVAAFIVAVSIILVMALRKVKYESPRIFIEALGPARGLTAVEAAVILDLKPIRVLTMILFSLLLKRAVTVVSTEPILRLKKMEEAGSEEVNLRYYEISFLRAIRPDGSLDEQMLARTYLELKDTVNLKIRGFSRIDTINYYRSIVDRAWQQVTQANTPELKCDALEENIEWLLADERFEENLKIAFPPDIIIYPRPGWWWYWGWPRNQPPTQSDRREVKPTPIPGQEFTNNIVLAIQKAANNIVLNVQGFANRLIPIQRVQVPQRPLRYPNCVCACASCACACACVSCACACAHGGAR